MITHLKLVKIAIAAALDAGKAIMEIYASGDFTKEIKGDDSPVTTADIRSQAIIAQRLAATGLPMLSEESCNKTWAERKNWGVFWMVDPLDGTKEFINKNGDFTINIALIEDCKPVVGVVYVPCLDVLYSGSKETGVFKTEGGKRTEIPPFARRNRFDDLLQKRQVTIVASRSHPSDETTMFIRQFKKVKLELRGSSLKFMLLAERKADLYPRFAPTMEWDTAAAHAILNAANMGVYQTDLKTELTYNKAELTNSSFVAF